MSEQFEGRKIFSLAEVAQSVQKTIETRYTTSFWVKAEMNKLNRYHHSGHCYPELVEKKDGKIVAQMRAHLWKSDFNRINQNFLRVLGEPLKDGIKLLFSAKLGFDPVYGISLWIQDIDPAYTLGDLEKEKQDTIRMLKELGFYHLNKSLSFPLLPQRIAVISVETSKGYADFLNVINGNQYNYRFHQTLFPALLQGDAAVASIVGQLNTIKKVCHEFDVVVIIRGGGGDVGLSCYNQYKLAEAICNFPIPILTGIGHSTNETVAEMVAYSNAITPTKLAEVLIQHFHNFALPLKDAEARIVRAVKSIIAVKSAELTRLSRDFRTMTISELQSHRAQVVSLGSSLVEQSGFRFKMAARNHSEITTAFKSALANLKTHHQVQLSSFEKAVALLDPLNVLKRGYSITKKNGATVKAASELRTGDKVETFFGSGSITTIVEEIKT